MDRTEAMKAEAALTGKLAGKRLSFSDHAYAIHKVRRLLDREETKAVQQARREGVTWDYIGECLSMSRQAAWQRWHHLDDAWGE